MPSGGRLSHENESGSSVCDTLNCVPWTEDERTKEEREGKIGKQTVTRHTRRNVCVQ